MFAADNAPADVLIIGAGASGGVAARALQDAGLSVVALEQGQWHDRADFHGSQWDWELAAAGPWSADPNVRASPADYPVDLSGSDMAVLNFNGVGGGTILYNAIWPRMLPFNFRSRSCFGVADDWPLDYAELLPFYEETDRQVGVAAMAGDPAYPPTRIDPPLPPHPLSLGHLEVARALRARRWHWWPGPNAILSLPYAERRPCVQRGTCASGCNEGAKSSIDQTHWKGFVERGGRLVTGARARSITVDRKGLANGAIWVDTEGGEHVQPARVVLCAANGIGTPRLLLASACERYPNGLANRSDLVGRRLMMHPLAVVTGYFPESLTSWQGLNGSSLLCLQFARDDPRRGFRGGAKWSLHPTGGGPQLEALKLLARGIDAARFHEEFRSKFGHSLMWSIMCEDLPDRDNRVTLSQTLKDSLGVPAPKLTYRTSEDARACLTFNCQQAADVFREAGAWSIETRNPAPYNAHFMGTAVMGDDPTQSVVDKWCMSHDIPNLGIIDGSVFVTSGAVNPTTTICALALRAAKHLSDMRRSLPTPTWGKFKATRATRLGAKATVLVETPPTLSDPQRRALERLGNALIPPVDHLPGAGSLLVGGGLIERVLSARPDLLQKLSRGLASDDLSDLRALAASDANAWMAVLTVLTGGYCLHPAVRRRIDYDGQVAKPMRPDNYPVYVADGLLDHLLDGSWSDGWHERT